METWVLALIVAIAAVGIPALKVLDDMRSDLDEIAEKLEKDISCGVAEQPDEDGDQNA